MLTFLQWQSVRIPFCPFTMVNDLFLWRILRINFTSTPHPAHTAPTFLRVDLESSDATLGSYRDRAFGCSCMPSCLKFLKPFVHLWANSTVLAVLYISGTSPSARSGCNNNSQTLNSTSFNKMQMKLVGEGIVPCWRVGYSMAF